MPRPMLHHTAKQEMSELSLTSMTRKTTQLSPVELDALLRKKRSAAYMKACQELDAGGHTTNTKQVAAFVQALKDEFPEIELAGVLIGVVSKCYLGAPYEVHTLDPAGGIIEHYKTGQALPGGMEKARRLAAVGGYAFIEVYTDCCRAIGEDGSVSVVKG